jgi:hypothetical protein
MGGGGGRAAGHSRLGVRPPTCFPQCGIIGSLVPHLSHTPSSTKEVYTATLSGYIRLLCPLTCMTCQQGRLPYRLPVSPHPHHLRISTPGACGSACLASVCAVELCLSLGATMCITFSHGWTVPPSGSMHHAPVTTHSRLLTLTPLAIWCDVGTPLPDSDCALSVHDARLSVYPSDTAASSATMCLSASL